MVTASDGTQWYQMASGEGRNAFYSTPEFTGNAAEAAQVASVFPGAAEGTSLRTVGEGVLEASSDTGNTTWYNSAFYQEPEAPHSIMTDANGVEWYAMAQHGTVPEFENGDEATIYNQSVFRDFMPGYEQQIMSVDGSQRDGHFEVRHDDGSGTAFYDTAVYDTPRGDYQVYEDKDGHQWFAISARGSNRDGAALRFVAEKMVKRPEEIRILMLISDGQPADSGYYWLVR